MCSALLFLVTFGLRDRNSSLHPSGLSYKANRWESLFTEEKRQEYRRRVESVTPNSRRKCGTMEERRGPRPGRSFWASAKMLTCLALNAASMGPSLIARVGGCIHEVC